MLGMWWVFHTIYKSLLAIFQKWKQWIQVSKSDHNMACGQYRWKISRVPFSQSRSHIIMCVNVLLIWNRFVMYKWGLHVYASHMLWFTWLIVSGGSHIYIVLACVHVWASKMEEAQAPCTWIMNWIKGGVDCRARTEVAMHSEKT